ncbi:MAG TPA: lytic murein transglycosylase [Wenzhouxiangellaceae bacterium]|nr:lytic murein transglycosylase [Wenzhouxiangellaceae bacterium]
MHRFFFFVLLSTGVLPGSSSFASASDGGATFSACIENLQSIARRRAVPEPVVIDVLGALRHQPRVIELDRSQPEFRRSFSAYLRARVTEARVGRGRELLARHRRLLDRLTREYGVPGHYLVSFWGMETNFGSYLGGMPTLDSLATLACDPRRSEFFTSELITALQLVSREGMDPATMRGSWAGAMGHTQFMPSAYMAHAVDGDGDGSIDLWNSEADALTSAANYLARLGWRRGERWGREVRLPAGFPYVDTGLAHSAPLARWRALGVRRADGTELPSADMKASVIVPMGHLGPAFLVYSNFEVIMKWNRSQAYAIAVGRLADRIVGGGRLTASLPAVETAASRAQILALQQGLASAGFDPGEPDGMLGPATRAALRAWQQANDRVADGYPDPDTLGALGANSPETTGHEDE